MSAFSRLNNSQQKGLTLVELMISLLLSSFLMLGVLQLFLNAHTSDKANSSLARLQENGRIALDMLKQDFRRTGYQGCATPSLPSRANSSRTFPQDAMGIQGVDTLEGAGTASDSLIMRHATQVRMLPTSVNSSQITFISGPNISFTTGQRYEFMLATCDEVAIFTGITSARSDNPDAATVTNYPNQYTVTNFQGANSGTPPSLNGMPDPQFFNVTENFYDVRNDPTNNNRPTLYKNNSALIADVDNFQVLYGVENAGSTRWVNADDLDDTMREEVNRLQVSLVISSPDEVTQDVNNLNFSIANIDADTTLPAIADRRLRRTFNTVIDVRNRRP